MPLYSTVRKARAGDHDAGRAEPRRGGVRRRAVRQVGGRRGDAARRPRGHRGTVCRAAENPDARAVAQCRCAAMSSRRRALTRPADVTMWNVDASIYWAQVVSDVIVGVSPAQFLDALAALVQRLFDIELVWYCRVVFICEMLTFFVYFFVLFCFQRTRRPRRDHTPGRVQARGARRLDGRADGRHLHGHFRAAWQDRGRRLLDARQVSSRDKEGGFLTFFSSFV